MVKEFCIRTGLSVVKYFDEIARTIEVTDLIEILTALDQSHFNQMQVLEQRFYHSEHVTPAKQVYEWYRMYPYTTVAAAEEGQVVGFVNLFPVNDDVIERLQAGTFDDRELQVGDIVDIAASATAPLHMFLSCIVVEKEARSKDLARRLLRAAVLQYEGVSDRCDIIIADNVTKEGENFCRKYGLAPARKSAHHSWIYAGGYPQFQSRVLESGKE